jgi:cobalt-zinc-cadmium efflux system membrane fusion protein
VPRFPGIAQKVFKQLGDRVESGETLAIVQSNESLRAYEVQARLAGTVIRKHVVPGELVDQGQAIYVIADLSTVWIDLDAYRQDFPHLRVGQRVHVRGGSHLPAAEGRILYISPIGAPSTQSMLARVELPNPSGVWHPGLFVSADVIVDEMAVAVAVRPSALQTLGERTVVFLREGDVFEARTVETGRRDGEWVEVASGLQPGQRYATENSFVLKADLGKAGAAHEH